MLTKFEENQKVERWKDTPFKDILNINWQKPSKQDDNPVNMVLPENAIIITLLNGRVSERWFNEQQFPEGLLARFENNHLELHLTENAIIESPIVLHSISETSDDLPIHTQSTIRINADPQSKGSILYVETGSGCYLNTPFVDMKVRKGATIEWIRASLNSNQSFSVLDFKCEQEEQSHFHYVSYQTGGQLVRSDIVIRMSGEETFTQMYGLNIGRNTQHLAHVVNIDHETPHCISNQLMKNILKDSAESVFDAQIHVFPDAQKINADQLIRTLLLNDGARALTIPRLEIYADDVRCTHGATIGYIEPDQLYYLRSRGINRIDAERILMRAYGVGIIEGIKNESAQKWLKHVLDMDIANLA